MMKTKPLSMSDIDLITPLYLEYFNQHEGAKWTRDKVIRRLGQLINRIDHLGLLLFKDTEAIGFASGQLVQFDDGLVFELNEILIASSFQHCGYGSQLLKSMEQLAKKEGAFRIQLLTENDQNHHHFYNELNAYQDSKTNLQKTKAL